MVTLDWYEQALATAAAAPFAIVIVAMIKGQADRSAAPHGVWPHLATMRLLRHWLFG